MIELIQKIASQVGLEINDIERISNDILKLAIEDGSIKSKEDMALFLTNYFQKVKKINEKVNGNEECKNVFVDTVYSVLKNTMKPGVKNVLGFIDDEIEKASFKKNNELVRMLQNDKKKLLLGKYS